jgi:hypothetical protein
MKFSIKGIYKAFQSVRFMQLFVFSLVVMLLQAMFQQSPFIILVISFLYLNALLVALSVSSESTKARWLLIVFWALAVLTRLFVPAGQETLFLILSKSIIGALLIVVIIYILHYVVTSQRVTINALFAAVVVYMLMAIVFAQFYAIIYNLLPGSVSFPAYATDIEGKVADIAFNYFSFVTIATLGYGDIVPRHPIAQMLASIEAVIGQFYVAILVAWLVSLFVAHKDDILE